MSSQPFKLENNSVYVAFAAFSWKVGGLRISHVISDTINLPEIFVSLQNTRLVLRV